MKRSARVPRPHQVLRAGAWSLALLLSFAPLVYLLALSLLPEERPSLDAYSVLLDGRVHRLFGRSVLVAALATVTGSAMGFTAATALETRRIPFRLALRSAALAPLVLPPFVHVLAANEVLRAVEALGLAPSGSSLRLSLPACGILLGVALSPIPFFFASHGLRSIPAELVDSAFLVVSPPRAWWRVVVPLVAPSVSVGLALTFVMAFLNFEIPYLLEVPTYPVELTLEYGADRPGQAFALALPAILANLAVVGIATWWAARRGFAISARETARRPRRKRAGPVSYGFLLFFWGLVLVVPVVALSLKSGAFSTLARVFRESKEHVLWGVAPVVAGAVLAVLVSWALAHRSAPRLRSIALWAPVVLPGALISYALIRLWNVPVLGVVYDSPWMLSVGTAARYLPVAYFALGACIRAVPEEQWDAADVLVRGRLGFARRLFRVHAGLTAPGLALAVVTIVLLQAGELAMTLQLAHPGVAPVTVRVYSLLHFYREDEVAALCLWHLAVVAVVVGVVLAVARACSRRR